MRDRWLGIDGKGSMGVLEYVITGNDATISPKKLTPRAGK